MNHLKKMGVGVRGDSKEVSSPKRNLLFVDLYTRVTVILTFTKISHLSVTI